MPILSHLSSQEAMDVLKSMFEFATAPTGVPEDVSDMGLWPEEQVEDDPVEMLYDFFKPQQRWELPLMGLGAIPRGLLKGSVKGVQKASNMIGPEEVRWLRKWKDVLSPRSHPNILDKARKYKKEIPTGGKRQYRVNRPTTENISVTQGEIDQAEKAGRSIIGRTNRAEETGEVVPLSKIFPDERFDPKGVKLARDVENEHVTFLYDRNPDMLVDDMENLIDEIDEWDGLINDRISKMTSTDIPELPPDYRRLGGVRAKPTEYVESSMQKSRPREFDPVERQLQDEMTGVTGKKPDTDKIIIRRNAPVEGEPAEMISKRPIGPGIVESGGSPTTIMSSPDLQKLPESLPEGRQLKTLQDMYRRRDEVIDELDTLKSYLPENAVERERLIIRRKEKVSKSNPEGYVPFGNLDEAQDYKGLRSVGGGQFAHPNPHWAGGNEKVREIRILLEKAGADYKHIQGKKAGPYRAGDPFKISDSQPRRGNSIVKGKKGDRYVEDSVVDPGGLQPRSAIFRSGQKAPMPGTTYVRGPMKDASGKLVKKQQIGYNAKSVKNTDELTETLFKEHVGKLEEEARALQEVQDAMPEYLRGSYSEQLDAVLDELEKARRFNE